MLNACRQRWPMKANLRDGVDWTKQDAHPENSVTCVCGHEYRSHSRMVCADHAFVLVARKPCGVCGGERLKAARSDPEAMTLGR
jgi:hypothetical protein